MISIERYAELCALMADTTGDEQREFAIAAAHGVSEAEWLECEGFWTPIVGAPTILGEPNPKHDAARNQEYQALLKQERARIKG